jgi:hypothetical protein
LDGGLGPDELRGQGGADTLRGGANNDTIVGDAGDVGDSIDGGADSDLFSYEGPEDIVVDLTAGTSSFGATLAGATLVNVEHVWGGEGDDSIRGDSQNNDLWGHTGDDTLEGAAGADELDGEDGVDVASYEQASAPVVASLADAARNVGDAAGDTYTSIEGLRGSRFSDSLASGDADSRLEGLGGDDTLVGGAAADTLLGGAGDDLLDGGGGLDVAAFVGNREDYTVTVQGIAAGTATHVTVTDNVAARDGTDTILLGAGGPTVERLRFADGDADVICFMPGTLIATPRGEAPVESLRRGDLVLTAAGQAAPVVWMGRQTVSRRFADPSRVLPVRIAAGAFGEGLPRRDLLVSADHALFLDGVLVHAGALVNGTTVRRELDVPASWTYWHVELADHALVLAEGVAAETFVDNAERLAFDNWAEHEALFPDGRRVGEMPMPRAKSQRQVPQALRRRLAAQARTAIAPTAA